MKSAHSSAIQDASVLKAFCHKHVPSDWKRENDVQRAFEDAQHFYRHEMKGRRWADSQQAALTQGPAQSQAGDDATDDLSSGNKRKRGQVQKQIWRLPSGAPIVPHAVYHNVETALVRFSLRKRKEFVAEACKYWTLKREARRGASLLKRLQLQMDSFSSMEITRRNFAGMGAAGGPRLQRRIEFAERLEVDMQHIRGLVQTIKDREIQKLDDVSYLKEMVELIYFPIPPLLWPILDRAQQLDSKSTFADGFRQIQTRLEQRFYTSVASFADDVSAVFADVVGSADAEGPTDEEELLDAGWAHSSLTADQKEKKKLAKRIIKQIQPMLATATDHESSLDRKQSARRAADLDALLDRSIRKRRPSTLTVEAATSNKVDGDENVEAGRPTMDVDQPLEGVPSRTNGVRGASLQEEMLVEPAKRVHDRGTGSYEHEEHDEATDDAVIRLQLGETEDTIPIANNAAEEQLDTIMAGADPGTSAASAGSAPSLSHSASTHPSVTTNNSSDPPNTATVTAINGDSGTTSDDLAPLANGGKMWYVQDFDVDGTTVFEDKVMMERKNREPSSEMSVLSEIGDDELEDLGGDMDLGEEQAQQTEAQKEEVRIKRRKRDQRRKRNRGW